MKQLRNKTAFGALLLAGCVVGEDKPVVLDEDVAPQEPAQILRANEPIPNRYIVTLATPMNTKALATRNAARLTDELALSYSDVAIDQRWETAIAGFSATMDEATAQALAADPRVEMVQEDGVVYANATQTGATWGLDRLDQASLPLNQSYTYPNTGTGTSVYVIDTGIRMTHTDFGGRAVAGYSAINDGQGSDDCNGHGTHVAGTVGGTRWGVAKDTRLVAVRVLDCNGSGSDSGVISGIDWVAQNKQGPSVINMSLGGSASAATDAAVKRANDAGVTVVVAAGNENQNACNVSPSRVPEAITVASSTSGDARSSFSNWGSCVDIFAPGSNITSATNSSTTGSTTMSGTSMASPHVAGAAALYLAANPTATPAQVSNALASNAIANKITSPNGSPNKLLNVAFIGGGSEPPPPPPPTTGTPRTGTSTLSVARAAWRRYQPLTVLAGSTFEVTLSGSGDPDLYIRFGGTPTTTTYDCASEGPTATEKCTVTVPAGATQAYIGVYGYTAANFQLQASWVEP